MGKSVRLAEPPFRQPLGPRSFRAVWSRHLRWARLRRLTFPPLFAAEIFAGLLPPLAAATWALADVGIPVVAAAAGFTVMWYAPEALLARIAGWPATTKSLAAWLVRDLCLPALFVAAWAGRGVTWNGNVVTAPKSAADSAR